MFWFFILDIIFKGTSYDILFDFSLINWIKKFNFEFPKFRNIILKKAIQIGKKKIVIILTSFLFHWTLNATQFGMQWINMNKKEIL